MALQGIFLDRDGTINVERADYVKSWEEFVWLPGALDALQMLAPLAVPIVVVTNQSAVGRGVISWGKLDEIHARFCEAVRTAGGRIDAVYVCPHHPDLGCECRKPQPGLLLKASRDFDLDLASCLLIGDSITDYAAAAAVGCPALLVRTGRQRQRLDDLVPEHASKSITDSLVSAARQIVAMDVDAAKEMNVAGGS